MNRLKKDVVFNAVYVEFDNGELTESIYPEEYANDLVKYSDEEYLDLLEERRLGWEYEYSH